MLGFIIQQLRKGKGWSQTQLSKELNVSPSTVGMYEQGRLTPDLKTLITLSRLFDVSLDYLVTGAEFVKSAPVDSDTDISNRMCCCRNCVVFCRTFFRNR